MVSRKGSEQAPPKLFLSYSSEDSKLAGQLKTYLEYYGTEVFLAHEDIRPGEKWKDAIFKELDGSDALVAILTDKAVASPYVNQEIGYALAKKAEIISFMVGATPAGFISETQGMRPRFGYRGTVIVDAAAFQVIERLMKNERMRRELRRRAIVGLTNSHSYAETRCKEKILETCEEFTKREVQVLAKGTLSNSQVYQRTDKRTLRRIFEEYRDYLNIPVQEELQRTLFLGKWGK